ncbi:MAG: hypothetical protein ACR2MB_05045 [Acidimicrobiales bacterium]
MEYVVLAVAVVVILVALALSRWGPPDRGGAIRDRRALEVGLTAERFLERHRRGTPPSNL